MSSYLKIQEIDKKQTLINNTNSGEFQIYDNNMRQKRQNSSSLTFSFASREFSFTNFGYSSNAKYLAYIYEDKYIILYNTELLKTEAIFRLPNEIRLSIEEYVYKEKRNFIEKMFTHLSFIKLHNSTNNIYISNNAESILITNCTYLFILSKQDNNFYT